MPRKTNLLHALTLAAAAILAGCAGNPVPPPEQPIGDAQEAIERARQANAFEFAALEFAKADRKLNQARKLAVSDKQKDRRQAVRLAQQARVDARLAEAKARLGNTRSLHREIEQTVEALRQEAGLPAGQGQGGETP